MSIEESAIYKRWLGLLWGYRRLVNAIGDALPERAKLKVIGLLAYDDPSSSSTVLELNEITGAQHGNLAGGALHAVASTSVNGFMPATDKQKLNNATASATASTLVQRDSFGDIAVGTLQAEAVTSASELELQGTTVRVEATTSLRLNDGTTDYMSTSHDAGTNRTTINATSNYLYLRGGLATEIRGPNVAILGAPGDYGGGQLVLWMANASTIPTTPPTSGIILYCDNGTLKALGALGTVTTIASP